MGVIRLANNQELNIIADGIRASEGNLYIGLTLGEMTVDDYDILFGDSANTQVITVIDYNGDDFQTHTGYTQLQRIEKQYNAVVDYTRDVDGNKIPVTGLAVNVYLARPEVTDEEYVQAAKILFGEEE